MRIAVRLEPNGSIYIDKNLRQNIPYTEPPYNFTLIDIQDQYADCIGEDFNSDLTFSATKYNTRKQHDTNSKRLAEIDAELHSLDYIGVKIATGRGTVEEYATQIARMQELANEKNTLLGE